MYNRKNDLILIMTPEKQDKTLELSKHWSIDSTPVRLSVLARVCSLRQSHYQKKTNTD